jgi:hypothetical protein
MVKAEELKERGFNGYSIKSTAHSLLSWVGMNL